MLRGDADFHVEGRRMLAQRADDGAQLNSFRPRAEDQQDLAHGMSAPRQWGLGLEAGLLVTVRDPALRQVVGRELQRDTIAGQHTNAISSQLAGQVGKNGAVLVQLHAEQAAGKFFNYGTGDFNAILFAHCPP